MKRRRFPILAALSFLLCLAILGLWVRSYHLCDVVSWDQERPTGAGWRIQWALASRAGCIDFGRCEYGPASYGSVANYQFVTDATPLSGWQHHQSPKPDDDIRLDFWNRLPADSFWNRLGFDAVNVIQAPMFDMGATIGGELSGWRCTFPIWLLTLTTAILPAIALVRFLRINRRITRGLCRRCGYDLRAHPPHGKCPECGTEILNQTKGIS